MMLEGGHEKGRQMTLLSSLDQPNESPKYDAEKIKAATAYARDEVAATPAEREATSQGATSASASPPTPQATRRVSTAGPIGGVASP